MDQHGRRLLTALEVGGLLLQHDKTLPSASAVVAGEPVAGSWWAHPMAHDIYRALNDVEDEGLALRCKLVAGKVTLVARHLWPDLLAVVTERAAWQTDQLTPAADRLLRNVDDRAGPLLLDRTNREAGKRLERALLVCSEEVHLESGRHTKGLVPWSQIERSRGVGRAPDPGASRTVLTSIVEAWNPPTHLLPWPARP